MEYIDLFDQDNNPLNISKEIIIIKASMAVGNGTSFLCDANDTNRFVGILSIL